jgi:hypothetical protein
MVKENALLSEPLFSLTFLPPVTLLRSDSNDMNSKADTAFPFVM